MKLTNRAAGLLTFGLLTMIAFTSVAWACTYQPNVLLLDVQSGRARSNVVVQGQGVPPGQIVQVRWNGAQGAKLAEVRSGPEGAFSAPITIPDAAPDVYSIVVVEGSSGVGRLAFEVTSAGSEWPLEAATTSGLAAELWSGFSAPGHGTAAGLTAPSAQSPVESPRSGLGMALLAVGLAASMFSTGAIVRQRKATRPV